MTNGPWAQCRYSFSWVLYSVRTCLDDPKSCTEVMKGRSEAVRGVMWGVPVLGMPQPHNLIIEKAESEDMTAQMYPGRSRVELSFSTPCVPIRHEKLAFSGRLIGQSRWSRPWPRRIRMLRCAFGSPAGGHHLARFDLNLNVGF